MIALSYSRLSTYEQCPFKFKSQYIDKSYPDESKNFHFIKGEKKHKQLDNYIKCKNNPTMVNMMYDGDVQDATKIVDTLLLAGYALKSECQLAVDKNFKPCEWFDKKTMFRAICDVIGILNIMAIVGDWKTGKFRDYDESKTGQLHLSSAIVFAHSAEIQEIKTAYFFIEHKQTVQRRFDRAMYEGGLVTPFLEAFDTVNSDKEFEPKRNKYCNFCLIKDKCPLF